MDNVSGRGHGGPSSNAPSELVEAIPAVIYEAEPGAEGAWRYVSGHIRTLLGYTPEEWTADPTLYVRSLHPYDREAVVRIEDREIDAARSGDVTAVSEYRMLTKDGGVVWVRDEARIAGDESSPVWQGLLIDITARARPRGRLRQLPQPRREPPGGALPLRARAGGSLDVPLAAGGGARRLLGGRADVGRETSRAALVHPDDRERVLAEEAEDLEADSGTQWVREYRLLHRLGRQVWVRDRGIVSGGLGAKADGRGHHHRHQRDARGRRHHGGGARRVPAELPEVRLGLGLGADRGVRAMRQLGCR